MNTIADDKLIEPNGSLSKFLNDARHNIVVTIENLRPQYEALASIDKIYCDMIDNLNQSPEFFAGFFLIRTHSSFRGAARLCLSGQCVETYTLLRSCLESALYGLYVAGKTERQEIWLHRHDDDKSRKRVKDEFKIHKVLAHLQSIDPRTHDIAKELYERTIDYGGHPNQRAVQATIKTQLSGLLASFTAEYFICGDVQHHFSLKSTAQIGICCLDIFFSVFRDRYRILGLDERLDQIRKGF